MERLLLETSLLHQIITIHLPTNHSLHLQRHQGWYVLRTPQYHASKFVGTFYFAERLNQITQLV